MLYRSYNNNVKGATVVLYSIATSDDLKVSGATKPRSDTNLAMFRSPEAIQTADKSNFLTLCHPSSVIVTRLIY